MHRIVPLDAAASSLSPTAEGSPRIERVADIAAVKVALPPLAFGHTDFTERAITEHPDPGSWAATEYVAQRRAVTLIRDAVVRSPAGILTIDDVVLSETLMHVPPAELGGRHDGSHIDFEPNQAERSVGRAAHLLAAGSANYYHWMTDVTARALLAEALGWGAVPLFGAFTMAFQLQTADLLGPSFVRRFGLPPDVSLRCRELIYVPELTGVGFAPPSLPAAHLRPAPQRDRLTQTAVAPYLRRPLGQFAPPSAQ